MGIIITAEIGINHNGDMSICKELIDIASSSGADCVKFQKRDINEVYTQQYLDSPRQSPWGTTQREQKQGLEFTKEQYQEIDKYCKIKNIEWFASAWDINSQKFLQEFNCKYNKVASAMIVYKELLEEIAGEGKHTFISTGMTTYEDIQTAVDIFNKNNCSFELMHTVSTYPMKDEDANLKCIETLKQRYNCNVGYSGHESSLLKVSLAAVILGATSVERHITLDRAMYGSDQSASISVDVLKNFVESVRSIKSIIGDGKKEVRGTEKPVRKKLRVEVK